MCRSNKWHFYGYQFMEVFQICQSTEPEVAVRVYLCYQTEQNTGKGYNMSSFIIAVL